jgi:hypothetical protein
MRKKSKRIFAFISIMLLTIIITRVLTHYKDLDIFLFGYELHHFYYGVVLLAIITLSMLFGHKHPKLYLALSAFAFGLIVDEFLFILGGFRNHEYSSTIAHVFFTVLVLLIILFVIFIDFLHKKKNKKT